MRENKIVPYILPRAVSAKLFCAWTGANTGRCTGAYTFKEFEACVVRL